MLVGIPSRYYFVNYYITIAAYNNVVTQHDVFSNNRLWYILFTTGPIVCLILIVVERF